MEIARSSQVSYFNDFDKELYRKWPRAVVGQISLIGLHCFAKPCNLTFYIPYFFVFEQLAVSGHCFHHILARTKVSSNMFLLVNLQNMSTLTPCVLMHECIHGCMCTGCLEAWNFQNAKDQTNIK